MSINSEKHGHAAAVGRSTLEIMQLLQVYWEHARSGVDGSWGDDFFRVAGFVHQLVGISLFPELWDAWAYAGMRQALDDQDPNSDLSAEGHPHAMLWPDQRPVGWDEDPSIYAAQIADVAERLRTVIVSNTAVAGLVLPGDPGPWNPATAEPPPLTMEQEDVVGEVMDTAGQIAGGIRAVYDMPIIDWCLAVLEVITEILVAIFGEAGGVQNIYPGPLAPGEGEQWLVYATTVSLLLDRLLDECRARSGVLLGAGRAMTSATLAKSKTAPGKTTRTALVVAVGAGAAALVIWAALA